MVGVAKEVIAAKMAKDTYRKIYAEYDDACVECRE